MLALGLGMSAAFVVAAAVETAFTLRGGGSTWSATHLALAGAATVAIGTFMPHFAVTLAGTRPSAAVPRLASLALLAAGAATVVVGTAALGPRWAAVGAVLQLLGLAIVAWHVVAPTREPLARHHPVVSVAYGAALLEFAAGIALGGLVSMGLPAVLQGWAVLRATHAWLTLFGAVSVTIFATLVYLGPTVLGARIRPSAALFVAFGGIVAGPILAAAGFALASRPVAALGALIAFGGAIGQVAFVVDAYRRRGAFTSEHDWRRVAIGHLLAGTGWFAAAIGVALGELVLGRGLVGWSLGTLGVPMIAGWMLQELVGSWTYLVPSVTPGDAASHARQRRVLAVASRSRLAAWNVGVGLLWLGAAAGATAVAVIGGASLGVAVAISVVALARALLVPFVDSSSATPAGP